MHLQVIFIIPPRDISRKFIIPPWSISKSVMLKWWISHSNFAQTMYLIIWHTALSYRCIFKNFFYFFVTFAPTSATVICLYSMTLTLLEKSNKNKLINIFGIRTTSTQLFINFLQFLSNNKKYINTSDNSENSAVFRMKIFLFKLLKKIKNQTGSSYPISLSHLWAISPSPSVFLLLLLD